ncbi:MAG: carboxymuconolactone decarboxylase family protein [Polyangia bacterium]
MTLDEDFAATLKRDWRQAPLDDADRAILEYAEKLTLHPARMQREDSERLRAATGLDDRGVVQVTLIASFFNYVSRVADALGVGREG